MASFNIVIIGFVALLVQQIICQNVTTPNSVTTGATYQTTSGAPTTRVTTMQTNATMTTKKLLTTSSKVQTSANESVTTNTMTTTPKPTAAPLNCSSPECHQYSYCNNATNKCICPTTTSSLQEDVCGSDGNTYGNMEKLKAESCNTDKKVEKEYDGKCKDDDESGNRQTIIVVVILILVILVVVVFAGVMFWKKRKQGVSTAWCPEEKNIAE